MEYGGCIERLELKSVEGGECGDGFVCVNKWGTAIAIIKQIPQRKGRKVNAMTFAVKLHTLNYLRLSFSQAMADPQTPIIILVQSLSEILGSTLLY